MAEHVAVKTGQVWVDVLFTVNGGRLSFICMIPPWKVGTRIMLVLAKTGEFWYASVALIRMFMNLFRISRTFKICHARYPKGLITSV